MGFCQVCAFRMHRCAHSPLTTQVPTRNSVVSNGTAALAQASLHLLKGTLKPLLHIVPLWGPQISTVDHARWTLSQMSTSSVQCSLPFKSLLQTAPWFCTPPFFIYFFAWSWQRPSKAGPFLFRQLTAFGLTHVQVKHAYHPAWGCLRTSLEAGTGGPILDHSGLVQWELVVGAGSFWVAPLVREVFQRDSGPLWGQGVLQEAIGPRRCCIAAPFLHSFCNPRVLWLNTEPVLICPHAQRNEM